MRSPQRLILITAALTLVLGVLRVALFAHGDSRSVVRHDVSLVVGPDTVDVFLTLEFSNEISDEERKRVDRDGDGAVSRPEELSLDFEIDAAHGFWIAARATGLDGSVAHTTPVYVVREGFRFWKLEEFDSLVAKRFENLAEVERNVDEVRQMSEAGKIPSGNRELEVLAAVGEAKKIYNDLRKVAERERSIR